MAGLILPSEIEIPENEEVMIITKRKYQSFIIPYLILIFSILLPFLLIMSILSILIFFNTGQFYFPGLDPNQPSFWMSVTIYSVIFMVLLVLVPLAGYFYCRSHRFIITNNRFIVYKKFIFLTIRETLLKNITDLLLRQGPIARWKNYGGISPITPGMEFTRYYGGTYGALIGGSQVQTVKFIGMEGIPNPFYIVAQLTHVQRHGKLREDM